VELQNRLQVVEWSGIYGVKLVEWSEVLPNMPHEQKYWLAWRGDEEIVRREK
jgi:hypothetical protein